MQKKKIRNGGEIHSYGMMYITYTDYILLLLQEVSQYSVQVAIKGEVSREFDVI